MISLFLLYKVLGRYKIPGIARNSKKKVAWKSINQPALFSILKRMVKVEEYREYLTEAFCDFGMEVLLLF